MNDDHRAGLCVSESIIINAQHVASLWPQPETHFAGVPSYSHGASWEEDEKWKTIYEDRFVARWKGLPVPDREVWWWRDIARYIVTLKNKSRSRGINEQLQPNHPDGPLDTRC